MANNKPDGTYNWDRTKKMQDGKYVDVNVVHDGQRAVLNGVDVVADGKGNWIDRKYYGMSNYNDGKRKPLGSYRADVDGGATGRRVAYQGIMYDTAIPMHKTMLEDAQRISNIDNGFDTLTPEETRQALKLANEPKTKKLEEDSTVTPIKNPSNPPRNAAEFGDYMQTLTDKYKIKFPGEQERNGYQSIYLPGTRSAGEDESAADNKVMGRSPQQAIDLVNGGTTEIVIGGNMGAQTGTSSAPDKGDQSRVVKGFNGHEFGGEHEAPPTIFRDKRSRALLDYDGDGGMMGAMRAAEAAQNTIKQNGVLYALDGEGKGTALDEDTAREFKKDGNKMASQDFLRNYRYPETPAESQSADSLEPEMPTSDINKDTGTFTSGMESNVIKDPSEAFRALGLNVRR